MDITNRIRLLTIGTSAMFLIGMVLVAIVQILTLTIIGFVLISLSGLVFVADMKNVIIKEDRDRRE